MMGGGFGGCTINLVKKNAVDVFIQGVQGQFKEQFDLIAEAYPVNLSRGAFTSDLD